MSCQYYNLDSGLFSFDYTCIKDPDNKRIIDSDHYYKYCRDYNYRECPIYRHEESSGPCFITTVVCGILGYPDNHGVLKDLRNFRDNVLQKDEKYAEILKIYDVIGPLVVDELMKDKNKEQLALELYNLSLLPIVEEIRNNNYPRAIKHYLYMTLSLVSEFNLRNTYNSLADSNFGYKPGEFNQEKSGHGYGCKLLTKELLN